MTVNLKLMSAKFKEDKKFEFTLTKLGEFQRKRHSYSKRLSSLELDISEDYNNQSEIYAFLRNYGFKWSSKYKSNKFAKPTIVEVIDGLKLLIKSRLEEEFKDSKKKELDAYIK